MHKLIVVEQQVHLRVLQVAHGLVRVGVIEEAVARDSALVVVFFKVRVHILNIIYNGVLFTFLSFLSGLQKLLR